MKKSQKFWLFIGIIILLIIGFFILKNSTKKITYIEYFKMGENCESILEMCDSNIKIEQEFKIPYEMFSGVSVRIGTYGRENNSRYELAVMDKTLNKEITSFEFNTTSANDYEYYELMLDKPIEVDSSHQFSLIIKAKTLVNAENGIAFYVDNNKNISNNGNLYYNNAPYEANLCMNVYGGNSNEFWFIFTLICEVYVFGIVFYIIYLLLKQKNIKGNSKIEAGILGIIVFALLATLTGIETFSDEVDNIIGGMLIGKGYTLYVDYYTGHTPFAYFLCTIISLFKAVSVEQFRMVYYALIALVYTGLYLRHRDNFGKLKMMLLPIIQITFGITLDKASIMILSDNIQALSLIVLILEFLQYLKDEKLDWKRSIIVALSIFCGFGSAFVTIYAIFAIGLGVFIKEICYWKNNKISFKKMLNRYWKLLIACMIPFVLLFVYLLKTQSLIEFYKQAFKFNTEVYSQYLQDGLGSNIFQPFFIGITNFIQIIPSAIQNIIVNQNTILSIIQIILGISLLVILLNLIQKKEYIKLFTIMLVISFSFTRKNESFHEIATWSAIITIILMLLDFEEIKSSKRTSPKLFFALTIIFVVGSYMNVVSEYLFKKPEPISDLERQVIEQTSDGEKIFYDIYSKGSVYLIYKERLPMNRLGFILPWYMDWYELDTIQDLMDNKPKMVLYDEDAKVWEISGYDDYLRKYLHENYEQLSNKKLWILK